MRFSIILFVFLLMVLGGGAVFLMTYDIPPPTEDRKVVIPNDRFSR